MTGIYLRVLREGRWKSLDVSEMTNDELHAAMVERDAPELARWVIALASWIRDNVVKVT